MNYSKDINSYETPQNVKRALCDILLFGSRWYLLYKFIQSVFNLVHKLKTKVNEDPYMLTSQSGQDIINITEACQGKIYIDGLENLKELKEPVIIIGNHMSLLETFILPGIVFPHFKATFVVKTQLKTMKVFGKIMSALKAIGVDRKNPKDDFTAVINQGTELLKNGISVIIFPQSTRIDYFDISQFNSIGVKLAKAANVKIIPLAVRSDFLSCGKILRDFGPLKRECPIRFSFGKPIEVSGTGKEQHNQVVEFIKDKMQKWNVKIVDK